VDRHLGGVGAGDEVRRAEQVEVLLLGEPAAPLDDLVVKEGDVRGRSAKGGEAEAEKEGGDFEQG
jgi:hypothetical protein